MGKALGIDRHLQCICSNVMYSGISFSQQGALPECFGEEEASVSHWDEAGPVVGGSKDGDRERCD